ncbi:hypothetical protein L6452_08381 [Arctium lappa]|uniref:Uncharacterized protein n=1 Tax=Arctium lappa TaxID=4217 RepID=A0ACB9DHK4_ARCLA|nr:hypothetical protein L6452_08381 [Arctium lappa]
MHDVLQEMGLEIVRKCYPNSRLWEHEEIHDLIKKNRNLEAVEAIVPAYIDEVTSDENWSFSADVFEKMRNVRLLDICKDFTSCKPTTLPDELQWLSWDEYPFSSLPVANLRKLVGLNMTGSEIEHLWIGYKFMPNLKFIHLEQCGAHIVYKDDMESIQQIETCISGYGDSEDVCCGDEFVYRINFGVGNIEESKDGQLENDDRRRKAPQKMTSEKGGGRWTSWFFGEKLRGEGGDEDGPNRHSSTSARRSLLLLQICHGCCYSKPLIDAASLIFSLLLLLVFLIVPFKEHSLRPKKDAFGVISVHHLTFLKAYVLYGNGVFIFFWTDWRMDI